MPFNRNISNVNNNTLTMIKSSTTTDEIIQNNKEYNNYEDVEIDDDGDDEYNEIDDPEDDDEEENYFENIIKEVISDQIDSNNNESLQLQKHQHHHQQQQQQQQYLTSIGSSSTTTSSNTQVIKINEDDLLDQRDLLRAIFKTDLLDRYECRCDTNQGLFITKQTKLSKSLQRKLANLYQLLHQYQLQSAQTDNLILDQVNNPAKINQILTNSLQNQEYKKKLFRSMRSIIERILIDALMICDQYHNQLQQQEQLLHTNSNTTTAGTTGTSTTTTPPTNNPTTKLWCEIRSRGCQFLGPQMQDDVLRLILHALETVTRMSRKVLVLYVVHMLKKHYPKASKTSVGHVVQLLYRAGCFKVEKRENDSSLMELKKEYSKYPALRRQHDTQIIQIALESGIRMSPEQWSQKLFGDSNHKSEMQSIIDKLQSQQTLEKLISDFYDKLSTSNCAALSSVSSSPSSSFSTQRSNSCSSSGSANFDLAVNSLFLQVKTDFDFFAMINFEKKQPTPTVMATNSSSASSTTSSSQQMKRGDIGSGGESLTSEDDESSSFVDHHDLNPYDFDDDLDLKFFSGGSATSKQSTQAVTAVATTVTPQPEQTKIIWSLLVDCIKRASKIISSHIEYSSKMMSLIIANNTANRLNSNNNNSTNSSKQQVTRTGQSVTSLGGAHRFDLLDDLDSTSTTSSFTTNVSQMRTLVAMGPNTMTQSKGGVLQQKRTNSNTYKQQSFIQQPSLNSSTNSKFNSNSSTNNSNNNNTSCNLFGSNNIYDFTNTSCNNKPVGFYQQSNNIFDLNMNNFHDTKSKQFYSTSSTTNHQYQQQQQQQQQSNDVFHNSHHSHHQFAGFKHSNSTRKLHYDE